MNVSLKAYDNSWYDPGAGFLKRSLWLLLSSLFVNSFFPVSSFKVFLLRVFGARVGRGVNIKPSVNIKYPWFLEIGEDSWIGENAWIDNLAPVKIGNNVCISQGALLLTGNHNFKKKTFDLIVKEITLEDGVWIGAKSVVCPGVTCHSHAVLTVGSTARTDLDSYGIYSGNPAQKMKERSITT